MTPDPATETRQRIAAALASADVDMETGEPLPSAQEDAVMRVVRELQAEAAADALHTAIGHEDWCHVDNDCCGCTCARDERIRDHVTALGYGVEAAESGVGGLTGADGVTTYGAAGGVSSERNGDR